MWKPPCHTGLDLQQGRDLPDPLAPCIKSMSIKNSCCSSSWQVWLRSHSVDPSTFIYCAHIVSLEFKSLLLRWHKQNWMSWNFQRDWPSKFCVILTVVTWIRFILGSKPGCITKKIYDFLGWNLVFRSQYFLSEARQNYRVFLDLHSIAATSCSWWWCTWLWV